MNFYKASSYSDPKRATDILSEFLKNGSLSLILGAGSSKPLGLPTWEELISLAYEKKFSIKPTLSLDSTTDLKKAADKIKKECASNSEYLELIKKSLYKNVKWNFSLANKDLLIAITSLLTSKVRGNVKYIITFNFDDVLEWYFNILGLKVHVLSEVSNLNMNSDIVVMHYHGFLPQASNHLQSGTDFIVFSKKEFEDRNLDPNNFWKDKWYQFLKENVFLTIGLSLNTVIDDICPHIRMLQKNNSVLQNRALPMGFSIITPRKDDSGNIVNYEKDELDDLEECGIIPVVVKKEDIPGFLFEISQKAVM